jgi:hypothetical protein
MARSVKITTPIPTLEEVAKDLGIGKVRQAAIIRIMNSDKGSFSGRSRNSNGLLTDRGSHVKDLGSSIQSSEKSRKSA